MALRLPTFFRFQSHPRLCGNNQDVVSTGEWAVKYARDLDGWARGQLMLARAGLLLRGRRAIGMSNHSIFTEIAGISDLELYDRLEFLHLECISPESGQKKLNARDWGKHLRNEVS